MAVLNTVPQKDKATHLGGSLNAAFAAAIVVLIIGAFFTGASHTAGARFFAIIVLIIGVIAVVRTASARGRAQSHLS